MIISHEHRFIFLKTRKTAGTSVEVFLGRHVGPDAIVTPVLPPVPGHVPRNHDRWFNPLPEWLRVARGRSGGNLSVYRQLKRPLTDLRDRRAYYNHIDAQRIRDRVGEKVWNSYFKFCFERDPWDKVLSLYYFLLARPELASPSSLEDMVFNGPIPSDYYFYSIRGTPAMDFIGRYEQLVPDLQRVCDQVGIDATVELTREKSESRGRGAEEENVTFTPEMNRRIAQVFAGEIALLGYPDRSEVADADQAADPESKSIP